MRISLLAGLVLVAGTIASVGESRTAPWDNSPDSELPAVSQATGLNVADFNGDGRMDLVLLSGETASIIITLAEPDRTFASAKPIELAAGKSASDLAVGDWNEDGKIDLAVAHHDTDEIWLLFGKGDGTFRSPDKVKVPVTEPHCHAIVAADLNLDHHLDLVLAQSSDNRVWILLGDGKGKFAISPDSPATTDRHPYEMAVADLNRDGNPDIITANWFGKSVGILLGDGRGGFKPAPASPHQGFENPTAIAVGDLTGDGNPDFVVGNNGTRGLQLRLSDGKGGYRAGTDLDPAEPCYRPLLADLNGDGRLDVISTATGSARTISYWINLGDGKFTSAQTLPCANGANTLRVADLNQDGLPDLCVGPWKRGPILVWSGRKQP